MKSKENKKQRKLTKTSVDRITHIFINFLIYLSILFISDTGSAIFIFLIFIPICIIINSIIYGIRRKSCDLIYSIISTLILIPYIYIFMNESALIYVPMYLGIAMIFNVVGSFIINVGKGRPCCDVNFKNEECKINKSNKK